MEDKTNVIKIQRYHSPCGDLMLGSLEDKLCLCDWAAESHRDIVDRRLRKVLKGLLARGVIVVDGAGKVVYEELVPEITTEPNYDAALAALK